jgi:multidrug efflux pump subunit AcrA (membrane-fusion protein)
VKKFLVSIKGLVIVCILVLTLVAGVLFFHSSPKKNERLMTVKRSDVAQRVTISGIITPLRQIGISSSYAGYIQKLYVKMGQKVKKGDPVVSITESLDSKETVYPIRAPYDGTVVAIKQMEGEPARQGDNDNFIVRIDDLSKFFVESEVPEINIPVVKVGQQASIRVIPISDKMYKGIVKLVALAPPRQNYSFDSESSAYPIKIEIINPDDKLIPGMSAVADIMIAQKKGILVLPREFVGQNGGNLPYVLLKNGDKRKVVLGTQSAEGIEVTSGLREGEVIEQINYFD